MVRPGLPTTSPITRMFIHRPPNLSLPPPGEGTADARAAPRGTFHANRGRRAGQMLTSLPMDISDGLLALAGAVAPDGGRGGGQTPRALLPQAAPVAAAGAAPRRRAGGR